MDLNSLNTKSLADEGAEMVIRHPKTDAPVTDEATGEPVGITLLGQDSAEYRRIAKAQQNRRLERMQRTGNTGATADEIESNALELLVGCTKGWRHVRLGEEELPFSAANARRLYTTPGLQWLREQVDAFIGSRANFLGNSSTT